MHVVDLTLTCGVSMMSPNCKFGVSITLVFIFSHIYLEGESICHNVGLGFRVLLMSLLYAGFSGT
jgi:hypothetical protein